MCGECIEWGGATWHRYNGGYYERTWKQKGIRKTIRLHREVYADHHGAVPEGLDVHHVDGDKANNDIANLVAISRSEHLKGHYREAPIPRADLSKRKIAVQCEDCGKTVYRVLKRAAVCPTCAARRGNRSRDTPRTCIQCGKEFLSRSASLCSQRCVNLATTGATKGVLPQR